MKNVTLFLSTQQSLHNISDVFLNYFDHHRMSNILRDVSKTQFSFSGEEENIVFRKCV
jgi:hypothetical protein